MTAPDITIPDEALEEVAKEIYSFKPDRTKTGTPLQWACASVATRNRTLAQARAACLAMLRAWPGMRDSQHVSFDGRVENAIILPLPAGDANA